MTFDKLLQKITAELASGTPAIMINSTEAIVGNKYDIQDVGIALSRAIADLAGSEIDTLAETTPIVVFNQCPCVAAAMLATNLVATRDRVRAAANVLVSAQWVTEVLEHLITHCATAQEYLAIVLEVPGVSLCNEFFLENRKGLLIGDTPAARALLIKLGLVPAHRVAETLIRNGGKRKEIVELVKTIDNDVYVNALSILAHEVGRKKLCKQLNALVEAVLFDSINQVEIQLSGN